MSQPRMPSPAILVAVLALVAALAGTAVAGPDASTSAITKKKVKKIATNQINKLAPGLSVAHADSADAAQSAANADQAANAATVGGQSAAALQSIGRATSTGGSSCDPVSTTFITCASVDINLPSAGRLLVVANFSWFVNGVPSRGNCFLVVDEEGFAATVGVGEITTDTTDASHVIGQGMNGVTSEIGAGPHTVSLRCDQDQGDVVYTSVYLSAVRLGGG